MSLSNWSFFSSSMAVITKRFYFLNGQQAPYQDLCGRWLRFLFWEFFTKVLSTFVSTFFGNPIMLFNIVLYQRQRRMALQPRMQTLELFSKFFKKNNFSFMEWISNFYILPKTTSSFFENAAWSVKSFIEVRKFF